MEIKDVKDEKPLEGIEGLWRGKLSKEVHLAFGKAKMELEKVNGEDNNGRKRSGTPR